jgi:hypothetical protein
MFDQDTKTAVNPAYEQTHNHSSNNLAGYSCLLPPIKAQTGRNGVFITSIP